MTAAEIVSLLQDLRTPEFPYALARTCDRSCPHRFLLVIQAGAQAHLLCAHRGADHTLNPAGFPPLDGEQFNADRLRLFVAGTGRAYGLDELAAAGLRDTGLHRHYLAAFDPVDVCLFPVSITSQLTVVLALGRSRPAAPYSAAEMAHFRAIAPTLCGLLRAQWEPPCVFPRHRIPALPDENIDAAIDAFAGRLTGREREVVRLIFRGYSSKAVARTMNIAVKTEKVHRRNAYAKLRVTSQAELFAAFLGFLASAGERPAYRPDAPAHAAPPEGADTARLMRPVQRHHAVSDPLHRNHP